MFLLNNSNRMRNLHAIKKIPDKGKAKPLGKMKKNIAKLTPNTVTTADPSANLRSQLRD